MVQKFVKYIKEERTEKKSRLKRNNWSRDELILALDLYFNCYPNIPSSDNHKIIELCEILDQMNSQIQGSKINRRTPASIVMKLSNFLRFDSRYIGKGLTKGSKLENLVWEDFSAKQLELNNIASQIKDLIKNSKVFIPTFINEEDDEEFEEGRILTKLHKYRERNQKLIKKKKDKILKETGKLVCEVCNFDFEEKYGELGKDYIECHHNKPIFSFKENETTKLSDLSILCSNCHRMVHRIRPWKSTEEMKEIINN